MLRRTGPFSTYNRYIAFNGFRHKEMGLVPSEEEKSLLAGFGAQEARLLRELVLWSGNGSKGVAQGTDEN